MQGKYWWVLQSGHEVLGITAPAHPDSLAKGAALIDRVRCIRRRASALALNWKSMAQNWQRCRACCRRTEPSGDLAGSNNGVQVFGGLRAPDPAQLPSGALHQKTYRPFSLPPNNTNFLPYSSHSSRRYGAARVCSFTKTIYCNRRARRRRCRICRWRLPKCSELWLINRSIRVLAMIEG